LAVDLVLEGPGVRALGFEGLLEGSDTGPEFSDVVLQLVAVLLQLVDQLVTVRDGVAASLSLGAARIELIRADTRPCVDAGADECGEPCQQPTRPDDVSDDLLSRHEAAFRFACARRAQ